MKKALCFIISICFTTNLILAQTLVISGNGNLRSGPGTTFEVIGKVTIGMKVSQIEYSNDWYKIELPAKTSGWIYKTLVKSEKQGKAIVKQKPDTIQLAANAIADELRGIIQRYMKNNFFKISLDISSNYPVEINLSHKTDGTLNIDGSVDSIPFNGNITLKTKEGFTIISYPKAEIGKDESKRPALLAYGSVILKDYKTTVSNSNSNVMIFSSSGSSIDEVNNIQCIKPGKFECSGTYFLNKATPMYFVSGTIIFADNEKSCTFTEGSIFSFNSVSYKYTNLKWIKN